ncbi:MAG: hypothetical protein COA42_22895, partial [Alteromonadaceae bacterium]
DLDIAHLRQLQQRYGEHEIEALYPANSLQQGFVYHHLSQPLDDAYRVQMLLDYHQPLDLDTLQQAWGLASLRYPILRTCFDWDKTVLQVVTKAASINAANFSFNDISNLPLAEREAVIAESQREDRKVGFDLAQAGLIRFTLIKQDAQLFTLMMSVHHSIIDGWSTPVLLETVHQYYNTLAQGQMPEIEVDSAYLAAQQWMLEQQDVAEHYWAETKSRFGAANDINPMLTEAQNFNQIKSVEQPGEQLLTIDGNAYHQLKSMCQRQGVTLNVALQFAWHKLLQTYSRDEQTIVGTTVSGRDIPVAGIESSVGLYINTLPLALDWADSISVATMLQVIQQQIAALNSHSNISLASLQTDGQRLFHSLFVFENYPVPVDTDDSNNTEARIEKNIAFRQAVEKVDYPLTVMAYESHEALVVKLSYGQAWLNEIQAQRLLTQLQGIVASISVAPEQSHQAISLLDEAESYTLLHRLNQTNTAYPQDKTLHQLFEVQVAKTPDNVALVFERQSLTYRELNEQANQLAHVIRMHCCKPEQAQQSDQLVMPVDTLVALYLGRSIEMVVSILAVLKAGAAYVPISPEYPKARSVFILADTAAPLVLSQGQHQDTLTAWFSEQDVSPAVVLVNSLDLNAKASTGNLPALSGSQDLAYVIYTSGTTGTPKGVMIEHKSVVNLSQFIGRTHQLDDRTRALFFSNYVFDASVFELFPCLLAGSRLTIVPSSAQQDSVELLELINQQKIDKAFIPTVLLSQMDEALAKSSLKVVHTGGEKLNGLTQLPAALTFNQYGPTEGTVCVTQHQLQHPEDISLGRPIDNARVYVLDNMGQPVPMGVAGELVIGGAGVARGYLNQPKLTAEQFIANPFVSAEDIEQGYTRLYKTGDLVRWVMGANGQPVSLEYLGRNDFQVKIRGYRIELGEIENALMGLSQVKQAVVIDYERGGNKTLAAYIVTASGEALESDELIRQLSGKLPDYMLPATFTNLASVPLSINGKLDRRALPEPEFVAIENYSVARNEQEQQLCAIWQDLLGLPQVGINDNFFRIGGDSIVSIQLVSRLRKAGFTLQVRDIFDAPTVAQLSRLLFHTASTANIKIVAEQGPLSGDFALLPIQQWFFDKSLAKPKHWNQAFMIRIPGDIGSTEINQALRALSAQHDMLRCRFVEKENGWQQTYDAQLEQCFAPLQSQDVSALLDDIALQTLLTQWQSGFDYTQGPLWQVGHLTGFTDGSARLFFAFHHLIIDAVSWRIITEDIQQLLTGQTLADKTSSYRQWVGAVQHYAQGHLQTKAYWQQILAEQTVYEPSSEELNQQDPYQQTLSLSSAQTEILLHKANQGYYTEINDLLLSALAVALQVTLGREVNHITLEGHGREAIAPTLDTSQTVGWFTTIYPVRLVSFDDLSETIIQTKEMLRSIPDKSIGFGALLQSGELQASLPAISFNYLGQFDHHSDQGNQNSSADWQFADEACGQMIAADNNGDALLLNINGAVQGGSLQFSVNSRLSEASTQTFVSAFETALVAVASQGQHQASKGGLKTPADYAVADLDIAHLRQLQQRFGKHEIEALYPANSLQQGFVYHYLSQPQDDAYRVQLMLDYQQGLDLQAYREAWRLASLRYPVLRMAFDWQDQILQVFSATASIDNEHFCSKDISALPASERDEAIAQIQREDRAKPFDLSQPGLIRFTLIKQHDELVTVLKTEHHSVSDGWSAPVLLQTVHQYYEQLIQGKGPVLEIDTSYFAAQQSLQAQAGKTADYWAETKPRFGEANDINPMLTQALNLNQVKSVAQPAEQVIRLSGSDYQQLKSMCQRQGLTLNVALQFAWHKLLQTYTQDEQTIVGTIVSGRDIPVAGIESSVGLYINTLPLAVDWQKNASAATMLNAIQQQIAALNSHSNISLASLQTDGKRLFHSLFVFENYPMPVDAENAASGIEANISFRQAVEKVDYPLSVMAYESNNEALVVKLSYGQDWLNDTQAQQLLTQLQRIVASISVAPEQPHQAISLLSDAESQTLLREWNLSDTSYPQTPLHQQFETQAAKTPDNIALIFEQQSLSYRELNEQANQLAHVIRAQYAQANSQQKIPVDTLIAIYLDRSIDMVVSILAVLKAGGAYVPISPEYPKSRSQFILTDTGASLLLCQAQHSDRLTEWLSESSTSPRVLLVDQSVLTAKACKDNLPTISQPQDLAYVIYTSGTTGQPKGVMIEHHGVSNLIAGQTTAFDFTEDECVIWLASYIFDASVEQLFLALLNGASVYIPLIEDIKDTNIISDKLQALGVTHLHATPSYLQALGALDKPHSLKRVISGGDVGAAGLRAIWGDLLINEYGPTESTITSLQCLEFNAHKSPACIGRPVANTQVYVLSDTQQLLPVGASGELYIGGAGVARGYLNRAELTAERFIDNPFINSQDKPFADSDNKHHKRLYKTGDLVRWLVNEDGSPGDLEYLGRNDFQVKIRGYRIELGEIENVLLELPQVKQAVVIDRAHAGDKILQAYIVAESGEVIEHEVISHYLSGKLPDYMVPVTFTQIDAVPLTINGKLDRRALPDSELVNIDGFVAPRNALEAQLCAIWQGVLGLEQLGVGDNFFRIGGNSITAIRLTAAMRSGLGRDVPLAVLFEHQTVARMATHLSLASREEMVVIRPLEQTRCPLSFAQERLLFIESFEQGSSAYHIPYLVQLRDDANIEVLQDAFNQVINRHPVLKSVYRNDELSGDYQSVLNDEILIQTESLATVSLLADTLKSHISRPFDLSAEASIRLHHYQVNSGEQYLLILWHHIAFDGWSTDIFMQELGEAHQALVQGREAKLPALDITYADYASWQRDYLQGENLETLLGYWQQQLSGFETLSLPTDHPRPSEIDYRGKDLGFSLDKDLSEQLRGLAKSQETTLYTVLLSGFYVTLAAMSGQDDIVVGTPSDNRHHAQTQSLIGFFVNSLVLRTQVEQQQSIEGLITQVHEAVMQAKVHQELPFEKLVNALNIERDTSRHPIYQVMFSLQNFGQDNNDNSPSLSSLPFVPVETDVAQGIYSPAKFDLSLFLTESQGQISGSFNYAVSLFDQSTVARMQQIYQRVLMAFVDPVQQLRPIEQIALLSEQELDQVLYQWNQTDIAYPQDKTLHQLFEIQAAKTPDNTALVFEQQSLTYRELNEQANQLAHVIRERYYSQQQQPMPADTLVALYLDRGIEMVVSILAVLKAGAAYVPISPEYPKARSLFILADTAAPLVLSQSQYSDTLAAWFNEQDKSTTLVLVDSPELIASELRASEVGVQVSAGNLGVMSKPQNLAYVIYTSGTSGTPKGVMIEHHSVVNLSQFIGRTHRLDERTRALFFSNYVFDASVFELFPCLLAGSSLTIVPSSAQQDSVELLSLINQQQIDKAFIPTVLLSQMDEALAKSSLTVVHTGGEKLKGLTQLPAALTFNQYGPTEGTVCVTQNRLQNPGDITIGRPIDNARVYVLGNNGQPVPMGAPGELVIGGAGVARGYFNQPELTAEQFIDNPFASAADIDQGHTRMYKTGDLVRWLVDASGEPIGLEYLGRNDFQVKIRGYRIELGEIENALMALPEVKQAVVIDYERGGNKTLAAYIVSASSKVIDRDELIHQLSGKLPDYMVPVTFTKLDAVPLSINGKLDRRALPEPEFVTSENYSAARDAQELQLCTIWQALLGLPQVGIDDNFFRIGGDSIVSIQLVSRLRKAGFTLQVRDIFDAPTVAQLSRFLSDTADAANNKIVAEQGSLSGEFALLPIQQWFFEKTLAKPQHWNQAFMIRIPGDTGSAEIEQALRVLSTQHDMLRCRFVEKENAWQQSYDEQLEQCLAPLKSQDVSTFNSDKADGQALSALLTQWQSGFDYTQGPLWQAGHLTGFADGSARLFFAFHHLIIDAVSGRIITEEMQQLLTGSALTDKTSSYRQWVSAVQYYAQNHQQEAAYWQQVLELQVPLPELEASEHYHLSLSAELTETLLRQSNQGYHTEINDLLLSALAIALQQTFERPVNHITLEGHGREAIDNSIDTSQTVGWFTTIYPVRLSAEEQVGETIIRTKEMLRNIPNKGIGFGALAQSGGMIRELPAVSFNYLGQLDNQGTQGHLSDWQLVADDCGQALDSSNVDTLRLNINGAVQNGVLQFDIISRLLKDAAQKFTNAFETALQAVTLQGKLQAEQGHVKTPSDYAVKGLRLDHLRQLQGRYHNGNAIEALYPANSLQQGFVYHYLSQPQDDAYRVQLLLDYQ